MAKKTDAWMPLYMGDYLTATMHLSTLQHGAYLLMLIACWQRGGAIPDDDEQLAAITKLAPAQWKKTAAVLRDLFVKTERGLENARLSAELARAKSVSDMRAEVGKMGGRPPKQKQKETNWFPLGEANDKQNETQSHSPSQVIGTQPDVAKEEGYLHPLVETPEPILPAAACIALKSVGVADTSPGNPRLRALVEAGATLEEFIDAGRKAVDAKAGFAYALKVVENARLQAAQMASQIYRGPIAAAAPNKQVAIEQRNQAAVDEWLSKSSGAFHA